MDDAHIGRMRLRGKDKRFGGESQSRGEDAPVLGYVRGCGFVAKTKIQGVKRRGTDTAESRGNKVAYAR